MFIKKFTLIFLFTACMVNAMPVTKPMTVELTDKGFDHYLKKNYKAAAEYFEQVVTIDPNKDIVRYYLTYSLFFSGSYKSALIHAKYLEEKFPNKKQYKILISQINKELDKGFKLPPPNQNKSKVPREVILGEYQPFKEMKMASATNPKKQVTFNTKKQNEYNPRKAVHSSNEKQDTLKIEKKISPNKDIQITTNKDIQVTQNKDIQNAYNSEKQVKLNIEKLKTPIPTTNTINPKLKKAIEFIDEDNFEKASKLLNELINENKNDSEALYQLGFVNYLQYKYNEALPYFNQAISISPDVFEYVYFRGNTYRFIGEYSKAEKDYKKALEIKNDEHASLYLADIYIALGKLNKAESVLNDLLYLNPNLEDAKLKLISTKVFQGEINEANDIIDNLNNNVESSSDFKYVQALIKAESEDHNYAEAISILDSILKDNPTNPTYSNLKAKCLYSTNDIKSCIEILNSTIESNPNDINSRLILAEVLISASAYDDAVFQLNEIEKMAKVSKTSLLFGKIAFNKNNISEADNYYDEFLTRGEGLAITYFDYAKYLESKKDTEGAIIFYKKITNEFINTEMSQKAEQELFSLLTD